MKTLLVLLLCICATQISFAQESDGLVSLRLPVRNSLTFNRFAINPTFSFVREQTKYISIYNKREWVQFDNAPLTYLASYSGRFSENIGAGIAVFQQDYGVLSTFGGLLNFAYNASLSRENNLTFGLNIGAYNSGINTGNIVTNFNDPSLQNVPKNFLLTINPGINLGFSFLDIGLSYNNLVAYNFSESAILEDNPESSLQANIMHTGYLNTRGFFDESKFSGLIKSEFRKDKTIISGIAMLSVPKGIWAQVGYNSVFGISGGVGLNITSQIAVEYNYEKTLGDLSEFGPSHDITIAYRFKSKNYYNSSSPNDDVVGLISTKSKRKTPTSKISKSQAEENRKLAAERRTQAQAEQKAREEAQAQAKLLAEQKAQEEAKTQAKLLADQKAQEEAKTQAKLLADQKAQEETEAQAKLLAEQKAQEETEAQAKLLAEQKAQEEAEAQAKLLADQKAQEEAEAQAKLLADQKVKEELITKPKDQLGKDLLALSEKAKASKTEQDELFNNIDNIVAIKDQDLKDLKEENDLNEQGIVTEPKPFKNTTAETNALNSMLVELEGVIETRDKEIKELETLYDDNYEAGTIYLDEVVLYYKKTLDRLKSEQIAAKEAKLNIESRLEEIKVATEFERNRRIKRAAFDNEEERYNNDRAMLQNIKSTTPLIEQPYTSEDFDFGEEQNSNIQILKNIDRVEEGYYMIIAVHSNLEKRNEFVTKVIASGRKDVDFFYDVNTSKYFIYYNKFGSINEANEALKTKGSRPYNTNMSIIKIEN